MEKRILLIDDDIDIVNILQAQFEKEDIIIDSAFNKDSGIEAAKIIDPDLILLDVMMSTKYEGFEIRKELLENDKLKNVPVYIMTSMDVIQTNIKSVQDEIKQYRSDPEYQELQVLIFDDKNSGKVIVDYRNEDGKSVSFEVDGFFKKPVDVKAVIKKIKN